MIAEHAVAAIPRSVVRTRVSFLEDYGLVYLANPKSASTSIKLTMRRLAGDTDIGRIHSLAEGSFVSDVLNTDSYDIARLEQAAVFSALRNPYRRVLSAYVDKVEDVRPAWISVCNEAGIEPTSVSFREFLHILCALPPTRINAHFCPQWVNVLWPTKGTVLLKLEDPDAVTRFFHGHAMTWPIHANQGRTRQHRLEDYYDAETEALVRRLYAEDFAHFGYPSGLDDSHLPGAPAVLRPEAPRLVDRVAHWRVRPRGQHQGSPA